MQNFTLVIFGITSNLAQIKLVPTLYDLVKAGELAGNYHIIGIGRTTMDQAEFATFVSTTLRAKNRHHTHPIDDTVEKELLSHFQYLSADLTDPHNYQLIKSMIGKTKGAQNRMFYLATFPSLFQTIFQNLKEAGITDQTNGWARLLIEKPIGSDRDSAQQLNTLLTSFFSENQIFRLDHYLGKETLQNILTFRFSNGLLEPLMNHEHIDHIQVTASEDFGIGLRGSYYDQSGALKDVGQNHLLQMIALSTMESPQEFSTKAVTDARVTLLQSLIPEPESLVLGQYEGYQNEPHIAESSNTETFFAFRTHLSNERFANVPIYVRGGKYLARTATEVAIVFKNGKNRIFSHLPLGQEPNVLIYRIQPNEGIVLKIMVKKPGHQQELVESYMQYCYPADVDLPDAYERLIVDALKGDQTFFNDSCEVDAQWAFTDPLIHAMHGVTPHVYAKGSWGPAQANTIINQDGRSWYEPSVAFCRI